MLNSRIFLFLLIIIITFHFTSQAQEESTKIKKLSKDSDVILTGKVIAKKSSWNESKTRIYTRTTVQVDEYLKGTDSGGSVEIRYPGGEVGEVGELYTHMPRFEDDEEVLVFLKQDDQTEAFKVLYGEEGKIKVTRDEKSNEKVTSSKVRLNDLKSQIKSYVNDR